jgi:hypothetical protein
MIVSLRRGSATRLPALTGAAPAVARVPGRPDHLLAFVAEVSLGAQLVLRHRAPRLAGAVAVVVALLVAAGDAWSVPQAGAVQARLALASGLASGVAAIAGSRLLAPGAALHAARYAATSATSAVLGRLAGAMVLLAAPTVTLILVLGRHSSVPFGPALSVSLAGVLAAVALAMATAPFTGAFASGLGWGAAALIGAAPPDAVAGAGGPHPVGAIHGALVVWHLLPLPWRAGAPGNGAVLALVLSAAGAVLVARAAVVHVRASRRVVR